MANLGPLSHDVIAGEVLEKAKSLEFKGQTFCVSQIQTGVLVKK